MLKELHREWQSKFEAARSDKEKEIARKRLIKIEEQLTNAELAGFDGKCESELEIRLLELKSERNKLIGLRDRFNDSSLNLSIDGLNEKINHIEQLIKPDEIVEFTSKYGPLQWNQTKEIVEVDGMVFTHEELLLYSENGIKELSAMELALKKRANARFIGIEAVER